MPQTPSGITLGAYMADPTLLQQQVAAQKQALLAKILANYQPAAISNPSPTGAFLQNLSAGLAPAFGAYLAGKSLDTEGQVQANQLAAQMAIARAFYGAGAGGDATAGTAASTTDTTGTAAGPPGTTTGTAGTAAPLSLTTNNAQLLGHLLNPEAAVASRLRSLEPPDEIKVLRLMGIEPSQVAPYKLGKYAADATQSYGPNTYVTGPAGSYITPSAAPPGVQTVLTSQGPQQVRIPGAAEANAGYQYQEKLATGRAGMETTPAIVSGPNGQQIATTQAGSQGRVVGTSPPGKKWDEKHGIYVWAPPSELVGQPAEPGPGGTTTATELAKTKSQIPQLQNKEFIEKTMPAVRTAADDALATLNEVGILRNSPVSTGPLTEQAKLPFAKLMALLHIDPGPLTEYQQFTNAVATRLYDIARDPGIRGMQTEGDAERFRNTLPSLANTPQANAFIADYMQANAMRLMRRQQFYDQALAIKREAGATDLDDINRAWKAVDKSIWDYPIMQPWIKKK